MSLCKWSTVAIIILTALWHPHMHTTHTPYCHYVPWSHNVNRVSCFL